MTRVKICGITRLEDALAAIDLGAAALGFNFYAQSPRYLSVRKATKILEKLPPFVTKIGVVVNWGAAAELRRLAHELGLDGLQLHGEERAELVKALTPIPVIKAFQVTPDFSLAELKSHPAAAVLLDGFAAGKYGGTGKTCDWSVARKAARLHRLILSGGLDPSNVGEAIRQSRPYAVDVASGVESAPGKKDFRKMRIFFAAVAKADEGLRR
jgi:phosphoribosylanthranilate isomerase